MKTGIAYRGRQKVEVSNNHQYFFLKSNKGFQGFTFKVILTYTVTFFIILLF